MFKKERSVTTAYKDEKYVREFMDQYRVPYIKKYGFGGIRFVAYMTALEFNAFCDRLLDLQKCGVYPIVS